MRESNFCNPAQNKASVCISSAVYDRRAIDCTATLPLINSLNHLAYLTSTSPRIREMVTLDGGLERLIRILRTVPKTPSPQLRAFSIKEMQAVWKWSLAFQCVVNIGVRGSESVRTRVVEAGMVPVTIRVLESYLRSMDRLKDERRKEALLHHQRHEARREDRSNRDRIQAASPPLAQLASSDSDRARLHHAAHDTLVQAPLRDNATQATSNANPAQPSRNASVHAQSHDRLLTETRPTTPLEDPVSARRSSVFVGMDAQSSVDDFLPPQASPMPVVDADANHTTMPLIEGIDPLSLSSSGSAPSVRPDGTPRALSSSQADDRELAGVSSSEDLRSHAAEASGSGSDGAEDAEMFADDADDSEIDAVQSSATRSNDSNHMLISNQNEAGADDDVEERRTPRPVRRALAPLSGQDSPPRPAQSYITPNRPTSAIAPPLFERQDTVRPSRDFSTASGSRDAASSTLASTALAAQVGSQDTSSHRSSLFDRQQPLYQHQQQHDDQIARARAQHDNSHHNHLHQQQQPLQPDHHHHHHHLHHHHHHHHHHHQQHVHQQQNTQMGRQETVHHHHHHHQHRHQQRTTAPGDEPRTAVPRTTQPTADAAAAHPAVVQLSNLADTNARTGIDVVYREEEVLLSLQLLAYLSKYAHVRILFHNSDFTGASLMGPLDGLNEVLEQATKRNKSWDPSEPSRRNVFSIAEKFTLQSSRTSSAYPAPRLSMEIQYWAGVIMRNACRKDESRGGIRQCANMLCGKWEEYPREFAKCRRCRKAKYCSKQCQSKGWQMGHRYWCSAKADESEAKDKEREKAIDPHRTEGQENANAAAPHIVPMAAHTGDAAAFAPGPPNEAADVLREPAARAFGRTEDVDLDGMDERNGGGRRWPAGDAARGLHSELPTVSHSEHLDGRSRPGHSAHAYSEMPEARAQPLGLGAPQQRGIYPQAGTSSVRETNGAGSRSESQRAGSSQMHRLVSSTSSSMDTLGEQRHAVSASEDDETWTNGAPGPGAPRLGMMPSPYTDTTAEPSTASWFASGRGGVTDDTTGQGGAFGSNVSSPSRTSLNDSRAQTSRAVRRGVLPGSMGLPSSMLRQDLRDRRVTSLASIDTVDGSDVSEDETERRLAQTQGIHPAFAAAAAAAGLRAREGEAPPQAPQRTDLAGRPLPPPVIASQNGEEDELALGGRATPGVAGEQDFATGEIDQMLGHWATRRPGGIGLQHRVAEVRAEIPSPERSLSPEASAYGETTEATMGARSDDEDLGATSRAARYAGLYGQAPFHPGLVRGQTPQPHHRLHQQRSASGFNQFGAHGARFGYGESMGETSTLQGYRPSMVSSPLAQTPVRRTSGQDTTEVVNGLEQAAQTLSQVDRRPASSSAVRYDSEDVAMMNDAASEQGVSSLAHSRLASFEDEVLDDTDDRDDISMEL
ncbi:related to SamB protein [Ustilago trichophora]|uniref:Related to SamB protein n=1 Tax=Ustilago trichophora TaxID=86804 RepID=A0A5C3E733_9BASI|nr:related to SamB protein [Ustilago trichophora]